MAYVLSRSFLNIRGKFHEIPSSGLDVVFFLKNISFLNRTVASTAINLRVLLLLFEEDRRYK